MCATVNNILCMYISTTTNTTGLDDDAFLRFFSLALVILSISIFQRLIAFPYFHSVWRCVSAYAGDRDVTDWLNEWEREREGRMGRVSNGEKIQFVCGRSNMLRCIDVIRQRRRIESVVVTTLQRAHRNIRLLHRAHLDNNRYHCEWCEQCQSWL